MTSRRLVFVDGREDAPDPEPGLDVAVLDTSWTQAPGDRPDVISVRPTLGTILERIHLFEESLDVLDAWAAATGIAERFTVDGVSWWPHARSFLRLEVHELLLWRSVLDLLAPAGRYASVAIPETRPNLLAAASVGPGDDREPVVVEVATRPAALAAVRQLGRGVRRRARRLGDTVLSGVQVEGERRRRQELLEARLERIAAEPPHVLAVARAASFHTVDSDHGRARQDPLIRPILDRLAARGHTAATAVIGLEARRDDDWAAFERDEQLIPQSIIRRIWKPPDTDAAAVEFATRLVDVPAPPVLVGGHDLGPALVKLVSGQGTWLREQWRAFVFARGFLETVRPGVLFTGWEGARTAWLGAARSLGIPTVAVQHGVIYRHNPDYYRPWHPGLVRPDVTCVFGGYERDILVGEGRYDPGSVVVTGSPRIDPAQAAIPGSPDERDSMRAELGVRDGDRMLVISAARAAVGDAIHSITAMSRLLDGPLPGTHLVFKLHPEEQTGAYEALVTGLASAGGYEPPQMGTVRDVDLYRLLRSADAHLGQYSTVLTDAVLTSTPNMISVGHAWSDVIGYVPAGVATAVSSTSDVRTFMASPRPIDPGARRQFLDAHFLPGDAVGRIADAIIGATGRAASVSRAD